MDNIKNTFQYYSQDKKKYIFETYLVEIFLSFNIKTGKYLDKYRTISKSKDYNDTKNIEFLDDVSLIREENSYR